MQRQRQSNQNQLQNQLNKLIVISKLVHVEKRFMMGYVLRNCQLKTNQEIKMLEKIAEFIDDIRSALISEENALQLMLVIAQASKFPEKYKLKNLMQFYQKCVTGLTQDPKYLYEKYIVINRKKDSSQTKQKFEKFLRQQKQRQNMGIGIQNNRSKSNLAECPICAVEITHQDISILSCGHIIHKQCFQECMKLNILNKVFPLKCPFQECQKNVEIQDIEEYLAKELVEKYLEFSLQNLVDKNSKNMSWCPTAGCNTAFEYDPDITEFECRVCKKNYCLKCKTDKHPGITCAQNKQRANLSEQDKKFLQFAQGSKFKQCPSCKFWVQKSSGCGHMTCRCLYEFCYFCGKKHGTCSCEEEVPNYYGDDDGEYSDEDDNDNEDYLENNIPDLSYQSDEEERQMRFRPRFVRLGQTQRVPNVPNVPNNNINQVQYQNIELNPRNVPQLPRRLFSPPTFLIRNNPLANTSNSQPNPSNNMLPPPPMNFIHPPPRPNIFLSSNSSVDNIPPREPINIFRNRQIRSNQQKQSNSQKMQIEK